MDQELRNLPFDEETNSVVRKTRNLSKETETDRRAHEIRKLHHEIAGHLESSLKRAIRIGGLLIKQKESLKHGEFIPWIKANLPFSDRTARFYMQVFRERKRLKSEGISVLIKALQSLRPVAIPQLKLKGETGERFKIELSVDADQKDSIELALEMAKDLFDTTSVPILVEGICLEWLEGLADPKKHLPIETAKRQFEQIYEVEITYTEK